MASALDMTLDDVIKAKGGSKRPRPEKPAGAGTAAGPRGREAAAKKAGRERPAAKAKPQKASADGGAAVPSIRGRLRAATSVLAPIAKAAAAAARATAGGAVTPGSTRRLLGQGGVGAAAKAALPPALPGAAGPTGDLAAKISAPPAKAGVPTVLSVKGTEAKLQMTLDDIISKTEVKKRRAKAEAGAGRVARGAVGQKAAGGRLGVGARALRTGRKLRMTLRSDGNFKTRAAPKAAAKGAGAGKGGRGGDDWGGKSRGKGKGDAWGSKGKGKGWDAWDRVPDWDGRDTWRSGGGKGAGGGKGDWGAVGQKRKMASDDWAPPEKRMRSMKGDFGWGRGGGEELWGRGPPGGAWASGGKGARGREKGDDWAGGPPSRWSAGGGGADYARGNGGGRGWDSWGSGAGPDRDWRGPPEREPRWGTVTNGAARAAARPAPPVSRVGSGGGGGGTGARIKVSNVPRDLDQRDIREAFEDIGRVLSCEVARGTAWITFERAQDAKKAMMTFDRGELNGQTILVTAG